MEGLDILRFILGTFFLAYGSVSDLRTRRVPDTLWVLIGILAVLILEADMILSGDTLYHHLILVPVLVLYFDVFWDRESVFERVTSPTSIAAIVLYLLALCVLLFQLLHFLSSGGEALARFLQLLSIPAMILVAYAFYAVGLLRGGADAKAFMAIALLVPSYPIMYGFPLIRWVEGFSIAFPFALTVLLNAALLLVLAPLVFFIYNISKGTAKIPECFFGYKADARDLPKFVWLMQRMEDGRVVRELFPKRSRDVTEEARKLIEAGYDRVWVTPQIPFLLPLTISFVVSFLVGNLLLGLFSLLS